MSREDPAEYVLERAHNSPEILHTGLIQLMYGGGGIRSDESEDVRPSSMRENYLCDFTLPHLMLERYWRRDASGTRPCVFLHVPGGWKQEDVRRADKVALGLIALCRGVNFPNCIVWKQANSGCSTTTILEMKG